MHFLFDFFTTTPLVFSLVFLLLAVKVGKNFEDGKAEVVFFSSMDLFPLELLEKGTDTRRGLISSGCSRTSYLHIFDSTD